MKKALPWLILVVLLAVLIYMAILDKRQKKVIKSMDTVENLPNILEGFLTAWNELTPAKELENGKTNEQTPGGKKGS